MRLCPKVLLAEVLGTFMLVLVGTGAIVLDDRFGGLDTLGVSLAFGGVVWLMIGLFGRLSGAHINPAVSVGFMVAGIIGKRMACAYIAVQVAGAIAASCLLSHWAVGHPSLGATAPSISIPVALMVEVGLTCGLMSVILWVVHRPVSSPWLGGFAIGGWVGLAAFAAGPLTGASMNPARSIGPAVAAGLPEHLWLYVVAPVLGAVAAVPLCRFARRGDDCCRACAVPT